MSLLLPKPRPWPVGHRRSSQHAPPGVPVPATAPTTGSTASAAPACCGWRQRFVRCSIAVQFLFQLTALLCFQRQRRGGTGQQARYADRLASFLAPTVVAAVDRRNRLLHLLQQLAFAVARAQCQRMFFLERCPVRRIGHQHRFPQVLGGFAGIAEQVPFKLLQTGAEKRQLRGIHVILLAHLQNFFFSEQGIVSDGWFGCLGCHFGNFRNYGLVNVSVKRTNVLLLLSSMPEWIVLSKHYAA